MSTPVQRAVQMLIEDVPATAVAAYLYAETIREAVEQARAAW